ncbi:hypothetical protein [Adonisia turfae]|nr:hypothetical protein [Adonisia turfae]
MAGRTADSGQALQRVGGALARRGGGAGGSTGRSPDVWTRRGARQAAQRRLGARAARGANRVVVRNPRTGRRFAVSARGADAARRLLSEGRQTVGRRAG